MRLFISCNAGVTVGTVMISCDGVGEESVHSAIDLNR
jgi:hypothetical protein